MINNLIVENVSKRFIVGSRSEKSVLSKLHFFIFRREKKRYFWVLKNISFSVKPGEMIGIIGKNGSGKSTLIRTIAGIYSQDKGTIKVNGNIACLAGHNNGFKNRLTMKDNIHLVCSLYGLNPKDIGRYFTSIVEFSELRGYENTKLYKFSTGMMTRLSFSIMLHSIKKINPKVLLLDEVFSAGDLQFKLKCLDIIKQLLKKNVSILIVSHHLKTISYHCSRAILMDKGEIIKNDKTKKVLDWYLKKEKLTIDGKRIKK
ncbi:ABC transporter ATP-binding protein [Candidatus Woesearchaeota archaeon]|nr:ABC transporter ATP-binding protein [Candidatus Woesearchaeota archaeon]